MRSNMATLGEMKKPKDEVVGFNVRCLDDGSYILKTDNMDYSKCKEYSYKGMSALMKGIKEVMGELKEDNTDYLTEKTEK